MHYVEYVNDVRDVSLHSYCSGFGSEGKVQLIVQMALWDTRGSGMDQHFAPELFAGTSKTTTFYKG